MRTINRRTLTATLGASLVARGLNAQDKIAALTVHDLASLPPGATVHGVTVAPTEYRDRRALEVELVKTFNDGQPGIDFGDTPTFVLIPGDFRNGTIEVDLLGRLIGKGPPDARAFIGLAYRIVNGRRFEAAYLRPLNGRKTTPPAPRDRLPSSISPIRTGGSAGCVTNIRMDATKRVRISLEMNGSHSSSISTKTA
jgi:hypothetical protein